MEHRSGAVLTVKIVDNVLEAVVLSDLRYYLLNRVYNNAKEANRIKLNFYAPVREELRTEPHSN